MSRVVSTASTAYCKELADHARLEEERPRGGGGHDLERGGVGPSRCGDAQPDRHSPAQGVQPDAQGAPTLSPSHHEGAHRAEPPAEDVLRNHAESEAQQHADASKQTHPPPLCSNSERPARVALAALDALDARRRCLWYRCGGGRPGRPCRKCRLGITKLAHVAAHAQQVEGRTQPDVVERQQALQGRHVPAEVEVVCTEAAEEDAEQAGDEEAAAGRGGARRLNDHSLRRGRTARALLQCMRPPYSRLLRGRLAQSDELRDEPRRRHGSSQARVRLDAHGACAVATVGSSDEHERDHRGAHAKLEGR